MIEIEKKVLLNPVQIEELTKHAQFLKKITINDTYYDTSDYQYSLNNTWIRKRDNDFEIKVGLSKQNGSFNQYNELTTKKEICEFFNIDISNDIEQYFEKNDIQPFISYITHRTKYKLDEFVLDFDIASFEGIEYRLCEFELLVDDKSKVQSAKDQISKLLTSLNIDQTKTILGKLPYFLKSLRYEHYKILVDKNVIKVS